VKSTKKKTLDAPFGSEDEVVAEAIKKPTPVLASVNRFHLGASW